VKLNQAGIDLIKKFEGCKLKAYPDPGSVDGRPYTIGYGATGEDIHKDTVWTQQQADDRLTKDLDVRAKLLALLIKQTINDNQFSALLSLVFNIGYFNLRESTLMKILNKNAPKEDVAEQFLRWNKNDGKVMAGLTKRREAEKALFLS